MGPSRYVVGKLKPGRDKPLLCRVKQKEHLLVVVLAAGNQQGGIVQRIAVFEVEVPVPVQGLPYRGHLQRIIRRRPSGFQDFVFSIEQPQGIERIAKQLYLRDVEVFRPIPLGKDFLQEQQGTP